MRADELLVHQGAVETRSKARALILAGDVRIGDRVISKAGELLDPESEIVIRRPPPYVGRGGIKLAHALDEFGIDVAGLVAADIGASTGGFTDVLLQRGATRVYAIDVGYGQLDARLRGDPRVVVMERVNARFLESLPEPIGLVVIDVSFISLNLILPVALRVLAPEGQVVALVKPQFEAGREAVERGGVVRDPSARARAVVQVCRAAESMGFRFAGVTRSPITGQAGNVEFLAWFDLGGHDSGDGWSQIDALFGGRAYG
jgi:23S rRNA (cytidine1920-2'-O)/16S rRNA (cytidine1409-2'-O)-methyltransferase